MWFSFASSSPRWFQLLLLESTHEGIHKAIDEKAWRAILTGWEHLITKDTERNEILKPEITWSMEEYMLANNNSKALNAIFNGVDANQFKLILIYETAKDA